jgi:hypothetical protein
MNNDTVERGEKSSCSLQAKIHNNQNQTPPPATSTEHCVPRTPENPRTWEMYDEEEAAAAAAAVAVRRIETAAAAALCWGAEQYCIALS